MSFPKLKLTAKWLFGRHEAPVRHELMPKVLYVHIPKAGGSAVNDYFRNQLGSEHCAIHAERVLQDKSADVPAVAEKSFVSAHMLLPRLLEQLNQTDRLIMTVLRNPLEQTISHLAWMRYQAEKNRQAAFEELPPHVQQLVIDLSEINLAEPKELEQFLGALGPRVIGFFDNCQTRYLSRQTTERVTEVQLQEAYNSLERFDIVGVAKYMQDLFDWLSWHLGLPPADGSRRVNVSQSKYGLDVANPELTEVLAFYIQFDQQLYCQAQRYFCTALFRLWELAERSGSGILNRKQLSALLAQRARE